LAEQLIDQSSSSIHLCVPLQRHPISRANQMPHHVPPLRLDRIYKSELQEHAPDKATRVHMSLRAAKLFILFVIWIPLHLMLCHSSTSRSASLRKLHQISSAAAAASFPCHNCKIIPQAGAVSRLPFFGSADKCNFIAFQLCTISGDDENEKTCSRPSTRNVRFAYIFDQAMNPEGTRESRRVSTQNFNVKARLHEHNSPVPPSKIKIAYERILITFAACRCVVFVPPVVPLPCITHNKVNIIIMHLLWPVITARNIECFPPSLPRRAFHIPRRTRHTVIIFQKFNSGENGKVFLFIQIMSERVRVKFSFFQCWLTSQEKGHEMCASKL
jgi:hypothetical protein